MRRKRPEWNCGFLAFSEFYIHSAFAVDNVFGSCGFECSLRPVLWSPKAFEPLGPIYPVFFMGGRHRGSSIRLEQNWM